MKSNDPRPLSPATVIHAIEVAVAPRRLRRSSLCLPLEQRFMFDGAAVVDAAHAAPDAAAKALIPEVPAAVEVRAADPSKDNGKREVVFVDTSVADYKTLEAGLRDGVGIVEIDGSQDGLAQIAAWAETHSGFDAIHILSHGAQGTLNLGTNSITESTLSTAVTQAELAEIGHALNAGGDLLIYGCDIATDAGGQQFVQDLATATGADVAASNDTTGASAKGGNWTLETTTGTIDVGSAVDLQAVADYNDVLFNTTLTFESGTGTFSGVNTTAMTFTTSGVTFTFSAETISGGTDAVTLGSFWGIPQSGEDIYFSVNDLDRAATMTIQTGKVFDLVSLDLSNQDSATYYKITTSKGGQFYTAYISGYSVTQTKITLPSTAAFQGISSFTITPMSGGSVMEIDNIVLNNIGDAPPSTTINGIHLSADTGSSATDFITQTTAQTITATLSAGLTTGEILYGSLDGGTSWTNLTSKVSGTAISWDSVTLSGSSSIEFKVTNAGLVDGTVASQAYTLDSTAPTTTVASASLSTDTGSSSTDFITQTAAQSISGTLSATLASGETVKVSFDGGSTWSNASTSVGSSVWSLSGQTLAGSNTLMVKVVDTAGNDGTVYSHTYTLDTTAPTTTIASAGFSADTGTSSTDFLTKTAAQTISGTLSANLATGETVYVSLDNGSTWTAASTSVGSNAWGIFVSALGGSDTLKVKVTDTAGNDGTVYSHAYTVDNAAPTTTVTSAAFSNDTGSSSSDFITTAASQSISGTLSANLASGEIVYVSLDNGSTWTLATSSVGAATWSLAGQTLSSSNNLKVRVSDMAGNDGSVYAQAYTLETTAPTTTVASASFSADSGTSSTDFLTKTAAQTISGTLSANLATGETVYVSLDNGSTWTAATASVGSNTWSLAGQALSASDTLQVKVSNTAGNSASVYSQAYVLDSTGPTITFSTLSLSADTGSSATDFVTNTAAQTISATLSTAPAGTDIVYGSLDNGTTWTNITGMVSGTTLTWNGVTLSASNTLKLKVTDAAGNDGTIASRTYTLDSSAPATPAAPDLATASDSGTSSADKLTNVTTPTITGTAEAGATVTLYDTNGSTVLGTGTTDGSGNWSITSSTLAAGTHTLSAKATDAAGNTSSASSGLSITVETTAPSGLAVSTTTINSSTATSAATIATLSASDAQTITYSLATGSAGNDADNGHFSISGTALNVGGTALLAGTYHIYVAATDAAGNASYQALTLNVVDGPSVTSIERSSGASATVATTATTITYTVTFDQAVSGVDTTDFSVTGSGTASGSVASVSGSGTTWSVTVNSLGGDGTLRLDLNGSGTGIKNGSSVDIVSGYVSGATYTLDHTAPGAPAAPDMSIGSDTGTSGTDNITSNTTPNFTGTAEANSTVTLYDSNGSTVLGTTTADAAGAWTITSSTLAAGSHTLTTKATDAAGNTSTASSGLNVTIDTTAPVVPSAPDLSAGTDTGSSSTDNLTSNTTPTFSGTAEANSIVTLYDTDGTTLLGSGTADGSGNWSITTSTLTAGNHTLTTKATDAAGNISVASAGLVINIDTSAPGAPSAPDLTAATDTGSSSTDNITRNTTPTFTGTAEANSTVTLYDTNGSTVLGTATADGSGNWSITTTTLAAGSHTLTASTTDAADNTSAASAGLSLSIDSSAPTITFSNLALASDTGSSASDFITRAAAQTITATLSTAPAGSDVVYGSLDGGATWSDITSQVSGNTLTWNGVTLSGSNSLQLKVTNAAGNDGSVTSQAYVLDITAPLVSIDTLTVGSSTPVLSGTASEGTLTVTIGGATYLVTPSGGTWQLDLATATPLSGNLALLPGNTYSLQVVATDAAGNSSTTSNAMKVVIVPPAIVAEPASPAPSAGVASAGSAPANASPIPPLAFLSSEAETLLNKGFTGASPERIDTLPSPSPFIVGAPGTGDRSSGLRLTPLARQGSGNVELSLRHGMADQFVAAAGYSEISVPADLFGLGDPHASVQLFARQSNGQALPDWIVFDARTGKFIVNAPRGVSGELSIKLVARDAKGHEVSTRFKIRVGTKQAAFDPSGRPGLSEQIRLAARHPGAPLVVEYLA
jgi:large repetitive protein